MEWKLVKRWQKFMEGGKSWEKLAWGDSIRYGGISTFWAQIFTLRKSKIVEACTILWLFNNKYNK